jgi:hypothetical protein
MPNNSYQQTLQYTKEKQKNTLKADMKTEEKTFFLKAAEKENQKNG